MLYANKCQCMRTLCMRMPVYLIAGMLYMYVCSRVYVFLLVDEEFFVKFRRVTEKALYIYRCTYIIDLVWTYIYNEMKEKHTHVYRFLRTDLVIVFLMTISFCVLRVCDFWCYFAFFLHHSPKLTFFYVCQSHTHTFRTINRICCCRCVSKKNDDKIG